MRMSQWPVLNPDGQYQFAPGVPPGFRPGGGAAVQPVYGARYPLANIKKPADSVHNPVADSFFLSIFIYF